MKYINYSFFRSNLADILDQVNNDHTPVLVTRQNSKPAVIISLEDFGAYEETSYLMASPKNKARLKKAIKGIKQSKINQHELID